MGNTRGGIKNCHISIAQEIIERKWAIMILYHLSTETGILRFGELDRLLPNITQSTLTKELRALEKYELIKRTVYPEVPPKVEYSLTEIGMKFMSVLEQLLQWSIEYNQYINNKNE